MNTSNGERFLLLSNLFFIVVTCVLGYYKEEEHKEVVRLRNELKVVKEVNRTMEHHLWQNSFKLEMLKEKYEN